MTKTAPPQLPIEAPANRQPVPRKKRAAYVRCAGDETREITVQRPRCRGCGSWKFGCNGGVTEPDGWRQWHAICLGCGEKYLITWE
jgi:hypothetical protein